MFYIIHKDKDSQKWNDLIAVIQKLNELDIVFNPRKSIYPRLHGSERRGKSAMFEIMGFLPPIDPDLAIYLLKTGAKVLVKSGYSFIETQSLLDIHKQFTNEYLFFEDYADVDAHIDSLIKTSMIKAISINPIEYMKGHLQGMELTQDQKLQLIDIIIKL